MNCLMLYWRYKKTVVDVGGVDDIQSVMQTIMIHRMLFYKTFFGSAAKTSVQIYPTIWDISLFHGNI